MTRITEQLARLHRRVETAAESASRDPNSIRIVAVSKRQSISAVAEAYAAGLSHFGENYLQEAVEKIGQLPDAAVWHFIGTIQSNKTRQIAENFDWAHTITNSRIAQRLSAQRPSGMAPLNVCLQIRPEQSQAREGLSDSEVGELAEQIESLPALRLRGLMIVPLPSEDPCEARREFERTRKLFEDLKSTGHQVDTLSMGMSQDLETAIMEGSTCVRIGTALFGPRKYE